MADLPRHFPSPVSQMYKYGVTRILRSDICHPDILNSGSVHRFNSYCRAICIKDFNMIDGYIFKPAIRGRAEFYSTGTRADSVICNMKRVITITGIIRLRAYPVVNRVDVTSRNTHIFTISDIDPVTVPVRLIENMNLV